MASNGVTISDKIKFSWPILLVIVTLVVSVVGFGLTLQGTVAMHTADVGVHHSAAQLKAEYMGKDLATQQYVEIIRRLDRIETKLSQ